MFFLQMSGVPGAGKSTLARAISKKTGAIVIDHDVVKSALLHSLTDKSDIHTSRAGSISYDIEWALIEFYLSQEQSVILDSPCLYAEMVDKGRALTEKYDAKYKYVECTLQDIQEIDTRLRTREHLVSQNRQVVSEAHFRQAFGKSKRPTDLECLIVDSGQPFDTYFPRVLIYLND